MVIVSVAAHPIVNPLRPDVQRGCIFIGVFSLAKVKEYVGVSCFYVQREPVLSCQVFPFAVLVVHQCHNPYIPHLFIPQG